MSALAGDPAELERLARHGIHTVADVLGRAQLLRELPDRSNHRLDLGEATWFVKCTKGARARGAMPPEAASLLRLAEVGVPAVALAFYGRDPGRGAITATRSLAPAEPLDVLLRAGRLDADARRRLLRRVAELAARLHDNSLHHRDLYLNHLYADPDDPALTVVLIDVERTARHRRALGRWVVKDLAALRHSAPPGTLDDRGQTRFLVRYLKARGLPRRGVVVGLARRVRAKAARMARHAPRTPVGEIARDPGVGG